MPQGSDLSGSNFRLHSETPHPVGSTLWILSTPHRKGFLRTHKWNFLKSIKKSAVQALSSNCQRRKKTLIFPHVLQVCVDSCLTLYFLMDCSLPGSSMWFSRQEYWSGLQLPTPGDLPETGIKLPSPASPVLTRGFFTTRATWEVLVLNDSMSERWEKNSKF